MQKNKGIRVDYMGVRFSTKGKKTKIRAFDITFKLVGFMNMTLYSDLFRIFVKIIIFLFLYRLFLFIYRLSLVPISTCFFLLYPVMVALGFRGPSEGLSRGFRGPSEGWTSWNPLATLTEPSLNPL
jgi:hypothetical protein